MSDVDLTKLRRFSLAIGLLLLTWTVAGLELDTAESIKALGLPLKVSRADLLPIALVLGSLYGLIRFYYYSFMLGTSPYRTRRNLLASVENLNQERIRHLLPFFRPSVFERKALSSDSANQMKKDFENAFPKFAFTHVLTEIETRRPDKSVDPYYIFRVNIPARCQLAALFQDIDYSLPIWVNLVALYLWTSKFLYA